MHTAQTKPVLKESKKNLKELSSLLFVFSYLKAFNLSSKPPILSFCAEPRAKSQNPSSNITLADGERVDVEDVGEGQTKILFLTPHPP